MPNAAAQPRCDHANEVAMHLGVGCSCSLEGALRPARLPVTGLASVMSYCYDVQGAIANAIDKTERKPRKYVTSSSRTEAWPLVWCLRHLRHSMIEFAKKPARRGWISFAVPAPRCLGFQQRGGMKDYPALSHPSGGAAWLELLPMGCRRPRLCRVA